MNSAPFESNYQSVECTFRPIYEERSHGEKKLFPNNKLVLPPIHSHFAFNRPSNPLANIISNMAHRFTDFAKTESLAADSVLSQNNTQEENPLNSIVDFEELVPDFSSTTQQKFEKCLQEWVVKITAFQKKFNETNKKYQAMSSDQIDNDSAREEFYLLKESGKLEHFEICSAYHKFGKSCLKRTKKLITIVAQHKIELALLRQVIQENQSQTTTLRYRFTSIPSPEVEIEQPLSRLNKRFVQILCEIRVLQQLILKFNNAFVSNNQEVASTRLPHKYYAYHTKRLEEIKEEFEIFNSDFDRECKNFNENPMCFPVCIDRQKFANDLQLIANIRTGQETILKNFNIIENLLVKRKGLFHIPQPSVPLTYPNAEENPILVLIERIITLKEKIALNGELSTRMNSRKNDSERLILTKKLNQARYEAELEILPKYNHFAQTSISTYTGYIVNLKNGLGDIKGLLRDLELDALARVTWNFNQPI